MEQNPYEPPQVPADESKRKWERIGFILGWVMVIVLSFLIALAFAWINVFVES